MKLNLGCGPQVVSGWCNVDYSLGSRLMQIPFFGTLVKKLKLFNLEWDENIYIHDLTKKFPWADATASVVYSSHTLEHLSKGEGRQFLEECHRVLKKGGLIRIVVPDLRYDVNEYLTGKTQADDFIEKLGVLYSTNSGIIKKLLSPYYQFPHKCMYDNQRLIEILNEIGFKATTKNSLESDIEDIRLIELPKRTENAVVVEGKKH